MAESEVDCCGSVIRFGTNFVSIKDRFGNMYVVLTFRDYFTAIVDWTSILQGVPNEADMWIFVLKSPYCLLWFLEMVNGTKDDFFSRRWKMLAVMMPMAIHLDDSPIDLGILKQHRVKEARF